DVCSSDLGSIVRQVCGDGIRGVRQGDRSVVDLSVHVASGPDDPAWGVIVLPHRVDHGRVECLGGVHLILAEQQHLTGPGGAVVIVDVVRRLNAGLTAGGGG